jgi:hypothetical protein
MIRKKQIKLGLCVLLLSGLGAVWAQAECEEAYKAFAMSDFDKAIGLCQTSDACGFFGEMIMGFSFLERGELNKRKRDIKIGEEQLERLKDQMDIDKVQHLVRFTRLIDKQATIAAAAALSRTAFKDVKTLDQVRQLIPFLDLKYNPVIYGPALEAVLGFLDLNREYVYKKGGTIPKPVQDLMAAPDFIQALVNLAGREKKAWDCLVLIEEPALSMIQKTPSDWGEKVVREIQRRIEWRLKKYPESTWFSAFPPLAADPVKED